VKQVMLDAALSYAERGIKVFPAIFTRNKKGGWQKLGRLSAKKTNGERWGATNDLNTIAKYWGEFPQDRIGIPTGSTNGFFCLDIDTAFDGHKYDGFAGLKQLEEKYGSLPITLKSRSPSGSEHHYFRYPAGVLIKNSASELIIEVDRRALGVDVRGEGGMVLAPPSLHPRGGQYVWVNDLDIAIAPDWLIELTRKPEIPQRKHVLDLSQTSPRSGFEVETLDEETRAFYEMLEADAGKGISVEPEDSDFEETRLKLEAALAHVEPAALNYLDWFRIGCAIYAGVGDEGFALFDEWSQGSEHYEAEGCRTKWIECRRAHSIGVETVYWYANQHDPSWRDWHKRMVDAEVRP
jgi:hypothetical protein